MACTVKSHDPLQPGYKYRVDMSLPYHSTFDPDFSPDELLQMGIFGGGYFEGYDRFLDEFPHLPHERRDKADPRTNYFGVHASLSRKKWIENGWMHDDDPRGWFHWFCRYDMGRRHADDERQIKRWVAFKTRKLREIGGSTDLNDSVRTRQGLLHWGIASPGMVAYEVK